MTWFLPPGGTQPDKDYYPCLHSSLCSLSSLMRIETMTSIPVSTIEPLDEHGSAVRFETQCVVIPDPGHGSRRPRVVTKSYSLPLWKKRTSSAGPSTSARPEDASFEENQSHLELRVNVPLPTYVSWSLYIISVPNSALVFRSNLTRRLALLITRPSRLVSCIVLNPLVLVLALQRGLDIPVPHGSSPLLHQVARISSQYPCVRVVQDASPSLRLLSLVVMRGQSIFRVLPRGVVA